MTTVSRALPCGDYGVVADGHLVAAVERKSLADLVGSVANGKLRYALGDLAALPRAAVVVEDRYSALFKQRHARPAAVTDALAECQVRWPTIPIVFGETRALAEEWTYRYLAAAWQWAATDGPRRSRCGSPRGPARPGFGVGGNDEPASLEGDLGPEDLLLLIDVVHLVPPPRALAVVALVESCGGSVRVGHFHLGPAGQDWLVLPGDDPGVPVAAAGPLAEAGAVTPVAEFEDGALGPGFDGEEPADELMPIAIGNGPPVHELPGVGGSAVAALPDSQALTAAEIPDRDASFRCDRLDLVDRAGYQHPGPGQHGFVVGEQRPPVPDVKGDGPRRRRVVGVPSETVDAEHDVEEPSRVTSPTASGSPRKCRGSSLPSILAPSGRPLSRHRGRRELRASTRR